MSTNTATGSALSAQTDEFSRDTIRELIKESGFKELNYTVQGTNRQALIRFDSVVPVKAWIRGVSMEDEARKQLFNIASMPFVHHHVAAMPDVHWGIGATVGSVIPTVGAIIPAAVGVN